MDKNTFGRTPAAEYLVRVLNELNDQTLNRSVGKRITATNAAVAELVYAYEVGSISAKTLANTMRLMREEVTNESITDITYIMTMPSNSQLSLVDKLRRNVQIGYIKKAIRQATVARKCETVMTAPHRKGIHFSNVGDKQEIAYFDTQLDKHIHAGWIFDGNITVTNPIYAEECESVTPELLHERSLKRCTRLGKAHTKC
jgi:hypothetical protein